MKSINQAIKEATKGLTSKQARFVIGYVANGNNGTKAALYAGYSEKTAYHTAYENLSKPQIVQAKDKIMSAIAESIGLTPEKVLGKVQLCMALDEERHGSTVLKACELAGKHLKLFTDKTETEVTVKSHEDWLDEIK